MRVTARHKRGTADAEAYLLLQLDELLGTLDERVLAEGERRVQHLVRLAMLLGDEREVAAERDDGIWGCDDQGR